MLGFDLRSRRPAGPDAGHDLDADAGQRGASLIIALAFMTVLSVLIAALFYVAFTNVKSLREHRRDRVLRYNADAALEVAVNLLKSQPTNGATGACTYGGGPGWTYTIVEPDVNDVTMTAGSTLLVTCTGVSPSSVPVAGNGARYVGITVTCKNHQLTNGKVSCGIGAGGTDRRVASATVMYDIDPSVTDPAQRAVVPKILEWNVNR